MASFKISELGPYTGSGTAAEEFAIANLNGAPVTEKINFIQVSILASRKIMVSATPPIYAAFEGDFVVVNATAPMTINLPTINLVDGMTIRAMKVDTSNNIVTINAGTSTIRGATTFSLYNAHAGVTLVYDSTFSIWHAINHISGLGSTYGAGIYIHNSITSITSLPTVNVFEPVNFGTISGFNDRFISPAPGQLQYVGAEAFTGKIEYGFTCLGVGGGTTDITATMYKNGAELLNMRCSSRIAQLGERNVNAFSLSTIVPNDLFQIYVMPIDGQIPRNMTILDLQFVITRVDKF